VEEEDSVTKWVAVGGSAQLVRNWPENGPVVGRPRVSVILADTSISCVRRTAAQGRERERERESERVRGGGGGGGEEKVASTVRARAALHMYIASGAVKRRRWRWLQLRYTSQQLDLESRVDRALGVEQRRESQGSQGIY
jgi:hypothetical protein